MHLSYVTTQDSRGGGGGGGGERGRGLDFLFFSIVSSVQGSYWDCDFLSKAG